MLFFSCVIKGEVLKFSAVVLTVIALLGLSAELVWSAESLTLISPNSKQKLVKGEAYTIKWDNVRAGSHVKIQLLKAGKPYKTIRAKTNNDGKYRWKIPSSVKSGNGYQIKITAMTKTATSDSSDTRFKIIGNSSNAKKSSKPKKSKDSKKSRKANKKKI